MTASQPIHVVIMPFFAASLNPGKEVYGFFVPRVPIRVVVPKKFVPVVQDGVAIAMAFALRIVKPTVQKGLVGRMKWI
jgi:hypothetical protein